MATVLGSFHFVEHVAVTTSSPITVLGAFAVAELVTITTISDAFSLVPVDAGSLTLTPVTPASLGALVPA